MYYLILMVLLVGQCITGPTETTVQVGSSVTVQWEMPSPLPPGLLYYRIRRSSTPAGSYNSWVKVASDKLEYTFTATEAKTYIYFIGAWYSTADAQGNTVVKESSGSNQVKITAIP